MKQDSVIADLIRECLHKHPEGCDRNMVYEYCVDHGAVFENKDEMDQRKSVSGQLSKMKDRGLVEMPTYGLWRLKR